MSPRRGHGARSLIFVGDMSDLFHEKRPWPVIDKVFAIMAIARRHNFQLLTKRPHIMAEYCLDLETPRRIEAQAGKIKMKHISDDFGFPGEVVWPLPNVWKGTSVERQQEADARLPHLLRCPARFRFLSCEPLLGPVDLTTMGCMWPPWRIESGTYNALGGSWWASVDDPAYEARTAETELPHVDWVICGGESGPKRRPMDLAWARSLRDQCQSADVSFFMKQIDKVTPIPPDLMIRQFPGHPKDAK